MLKLIEEVHEDNVKEVFNVDLQKLTSKILHGHGNFGTVYIRHSNARY